MDTSIIEGLGISKGEIKVYFSLLELGASSTGDIIKKAKVSRSKVYEMLDRLIARGLVSFVIKENIKYFESAHPNSILKYIEKKKEEITKKELVLKKSLPDLIKIYQIKKPKQHATIYEGIEGIKTMYNDILSTLNNGEEYLVISTEADTYDTNFSAFIKIHHLRRIKRGIHLKLLINQYHRKNIIKLTTNKFIKIRFFNEKLPSATIIYADNVATFVWNSDPIAVVIKSKIIANRYREFFNERWKATKS